MKHFGRERAWCQCHAQETLLILADIKLRCPDMRNFDNNLLKGSFCDDIWIIFVNDVVAVKNTFLSQLIQQWWMAWPQCVLTVASYFCRQVAVVIFLLSSCACDDECRSSSLHSSSDSLSLQVSAQWDVEAARRQRAALWAGSVGPDGGSAPRVPWLICWSLGSALRRWNPILFTAHFLCFSAAALN